MGNEQMNAHSGKQEQMPLPKSEGSLELKNAFVQGFLQLYAYQKHLAEEKKPAADLDFVTLRSPKNSAVKNELLHFLLYEKDEQGHTFSEKFGVYRDNPRIEEDSRPDHEHLDPHNHEDLAALYERVLAYATSGQSGLTDKTLH